VDSSFKRARASGFSARIPTSIGVARARFDRTNICFRASSSIATDARTAMTDVVAREDE
jgi:hypothetical protein